ncbi:hypothetical protein [Curvivirga aplysinae]|uniref:hypothetical protein n=1 Tax=Curvivirga aplysinae TaxID=2529852 RepID=UPI0012BB6525|nr:hypothetical protein [Curvivirga aplysinae]MTI10203.1 hypothetical protein [Curvivirga aplysinae]
MLKANGEINEVYAIGNPADICLNDLDQAINLVENVMKRPVQQSLFAVELAKCASSQAPRNGMDATDLKARILTFMEDVTGYSPDCVADAFRRHRKEKTFQPTPSEILAFCRESAEGRMKLRAELSRIKQEIFKAKPNWKPVNKDERQRVGHQLKEFLDLRMGRNAEAAE